MTDHTPDSGHAPGMPDAAAAEKVAPNGNLPKGDGSDQLARIGETLGLIDDACLEAECAAEDIEALTETVEVALASYNKALSDMGIDFEDIPINLRLLRLAKERAEVAGAMARKALNLAAAERQALKRGG